MTILSSEDYVRELSRHLTTRLGLRMSRLDETDFRLTALREFIENNGDAVAAMSPDTLRTLSRGLAREIYDALGDELDVLHWQIGRARQCQYAAVRAEASSPPERPAPALQSVPFTE